MSNIYIMDNNIEKETTNIVNETNVDNLPEEAQKETNALSREDQLVADIFTLQNGVYLGIFIIVFGFTYIYMRKGKSGASIDTRMVDFIVFGLIIIAILAFFLQNRNVIFTEPYWKSQTDDFIEYLDNLVKNEYTSEYVFVGNINNYLINQFRQNKIGKINAEYLGIKDKNNNQIYIKNLLENSFIEFNDKAYGLFIPNDDIMKRTEYNWFCYISILDILNSKFMLAKLLITNCK